MKCKRLCAWLLSLVMMFSLLPVSAAAAGHEPTIKWGGSTPFDYTLSVQVFHENEGLQWEKTETEKHLWVDVHPASGTEVYKADSEGGSYVKGTGHFTFGFTTKASLNLYTRSTAGHTVTVNYVFADKSGNTKGPIEKQVKYQDHEDFELAQPNYNCTISKKSGDATHEVTGSTDSTRKLRVTGGAKNSVFTVTYTPKDNYIYIDKYFGNGGIFSKWDGKNIKLNGYEFVENNALPKKYVIENHKLAPAMENYRFLTVTNADNSTTVYDFSYAVVIPKTSESTERKIKDVWYDRDAGEWYYSYDDPLGLFDKIPLVNVGGVNFCYNKEHNEYSEYHDFVATTTVDHTCTEKGYTDYKCKYCDKTKRDGFTDPLGHDWEWKHDDTTSGAGSQHYQVCKRCNEKDITENCNFDPVPTVQGTHTCTVCKHSYTDEITPTGTPVYVYFQTVNTAGKPIENVKGVTPNGNKGGWATLGKLVTTTVVTADKKDVLGAEVKTSSNFKKHDSNKNFGLDLISEWVELKKDNGAAGYVEEAPYGTEAWHLNGKVNVYKLSYNANPPDGVGVEAVTGMPDSAYYLPGGNATVSTADPTLQGYDFGGWYKEPKCVTEAKGTVAVTEDTVLYAKWKPITADLIDDAITIYHKVSDRSDWHGGNAYADASAHQAGRTPTISYKAELDLSKMELQMNKQTASIIAAYGEKPWEKLVEAVKAAHDSLAMFSGSEIVLHVQLDKQLSTADIQNQLNLNNIKVTSNWFELSNAGDPVVYDKNAQSLTITCVPKNTADGYSSKITLSGLNDLSLTAKAQGELSSDKDLDIISEGYIDGTIMISGQTLKLESKTAKNTAKLKLAVPTYTVTYDANGGSGTMTDKNSPYAYGAAATVLTNGFTRSRYTFTGWNTQADGKGTSCKAGDSIDVTGNIVLYAQWSKNSSRDDDDDKYFFAIQKVDAQDGHALNGAKFELYQLDKNDRIVNRRVVRTTQQSNKNGIALFSVDNKKSYDGIWYYAEVSAPEGYVLDRTEYEINDKDFSDSLSTAVKYADTVRNYRGTTPDLLNDSDHFAYVIGYMDGNVRPYGLISRAETTTIFFRLLKDSVRDGNLLTSNTYTDVADDYWANTAISTMTGLGIVQGRSATTFDPKAPITRAQFAAICARFDTGKSNGEQTFSDIQGHWAEKYIQRAAELGWIKGFEDGTFRPDTYITRAQAMTMINRVLNRIPEDESDLLPGMNVWPDCNPGDWFYLAVQEATNSHDFEHKAGNYETWTKLMKNPDWTRYEN